VLSAHWYVATSVGSTLIVLPSNSGGVAILMA
jgi:hypothetical protein